MTEGCHFAFAGRRVLLERDGEEFRLPGMRTIARALNGEAPEPAEVSLPNVDGMPCHAYDLPEDFSAPDGLELVGLRALHPVLSEDLFRAAGTGLQKLEWLRSHGFCSRCGARTERHRSEEAMVCPACGHLQFPRVSPAVIVLIERGREMLLARQPTFPAGMYSTVAGYVEPGESLEETVHREIREEVGVEVRDLRYFGSQPWPFPHSLMVGFTARWASGDIRVDGVEIEDARWFTPEELPPRMPSSYSIALRLLEDFFRRVGGPQR